MKDSLIGYKVGVLLGEASNPFWREMELHYRCLASLMGLKIECYWPSGVGQERAQLQTLEVMVESGFDLIIINPINNRNLIEGIFKAKEQGIYVIDVGEKTDQERIKEATPYYVPIKTVDFYYQGVLGAKYIVDRLQSEGSHKVIIIEGRKGAMQSIKRSQGAADTFSKYPSIQLIGKESADFDRMKAKRIAEKIFREEPEIRAFFCVNDLMALGVAEVIRLFGRSDDEVIIVGVDFIQESMEAIKKGILNASVAFSTESVAQVVLESALKVLKGEKIQNTFQVESKVINKNNIDKVLSR